MCSFFYPFVIYMLLTFCLLYPLVLPVALYRVFMPYIMKLHCRQIKIDCRALQRALTKKQQKKNPRNVPRRFFFLCLVISRGIFRLFFIWFSYSRFSCSSSSSMCSWYASGPYSFNPAALATMANGKIKKNIKIIGAPSFFKI